MYFYFGWQKDAACNDHPHPEVFYPEDLPDDKRDDAITEALSVCESCPVRRQCLTYSIKQKDWNGIWGGKLPEERKRLAYIRRRYTRESAQRQAEKDAA